MEPMDIFIATCRDMSYVIINHPLYSLLGSFVVLMTLLRFYCRLTLGICDCKEDLTGKTVLITGASDGIGKATARDLARRNARVLLACRNLGKANKVADEIKMQTGNHQVFVKALDLCSFESVRNCANDILKTEEKLHILINNAGIVGSSKREVTGDGIEKVMQSNHLGHFLLTLLLLDLLKKGSPSRIINVASTAYLYGKLDVDTLDCSDISLSFMTYYSASKEANIFFTKELASKLIGTGITVNSLCPGMVKTNIFSTKDTWFATAMTIIPPILAKSAEEGAQTTIHLAVCPDLETTTGKHFKDCKEEKLNKKARDKMLAKRLFETSEKVVVLTFDQAFKRTSL